MKQTVQQMYRSSPSGVRAAFRGDAERAAKYYWRWVDFVHRSAGEAGVSMHGRRVLDVGCGSGWSTAGFARAGWEATGIDMNPRSFEPAGSASLRFVAGSILSLPFPSASFDIVGAYQTLEHVPEPAKGLDEMVRVCRPGGVVCVVGPNLLGVGAALKAVGHATLGTLARRTPLRRAPSTPMHPYGNTVTETLASVPRVTVAVVWKILGSRATFTMREPDDRPPFHADNDACYRCNPTDLVKYFRAAGCTIVASRRYGRPPLAGLLTAGTWVAARVERP